MSIRSKGMGTSRQVRSIAGAGDRGSATVLVVAGIGVVLLLLAGALALTSAVLASHRARAAADLAALAGAQVLVDGGDARAPCDVASGVATRNGSALVECHVVGDDLTVTVATPAGWPGLDSARARARAGPGRDARTGGSAE